MYKQPNATDYFPEHLSDSDWRYTSITTYKLSQVLGVKHWHVLKYDAITALENGFFYRHCIWRASEYLFDVL